MIKWIRASRALFSSWVLVELCLNFLAERRQLRPDRVPFRYRHVAGERHEAQAPIFDRDEEQTAAALRHDLVTGLVPFSFVDLATDEIAGHPPNTEQHQMQYVLARLKLFLHFYRNQKCRNQKHDDQQSPP